MENDEITLARIQKAAEFAEKLNQTIRSQMLFPFEERPLLENGGHFARQGTISTQPITAENEEFQLDCLREACLIAWGELIGFGIANAKTIISMLSQPAEAVYIHRQWAGEAPFYSVLLMASLFTEEEYNNPIKNS